MADKPKFSIYGAKKELKERREFDANRRDKAENILRPEQIQGKDFRAAKRLKTTLGLKDGETRKITKKDLIEFHNNIKRLGSRLEKGITANEVISFSLQADIDRSHKQIHSAVPVRIKDGDIHFITNAGPDSKVTRHNVHIILTDYDKGLAKGTPLQAAKEAAKGNLKFDCDCEHHTFVFRYITTLMGANAGRAETGFPKLTNPYLEGIACKHVLRVMVELNTSIFIWKRIAATIEADRAKNANKQRASQQKTVRTTQAEADELSQRQQKRIRKIQPSTKESKKAREAAMQIELPPRVKRNSKFPQDLTPDEREADLREKLAVYGLKPEADQIRKARNYTPPN